MPRSHPPSQAAALSGVLAVRPHADHQAALSGVLAERQRALDARCANVSRRWRTAAAEPLPEAAPPPPPRPQKPHTAYSSSPLAEMSAAANSMHGGKGAQRRGVNDVENQPLAALADYSASEHWHVRAEHSPPAAARALSAEEEEEAARAPPPTGERVVYDAIEAGKLQRMHSILDAMFASLDGPTAAPAAADADAAAAAAAAAVPTHRQGPPASARTARGDAHGSSVAPAGSAAESSASRVLQRLETLQTAQSAARAHLKEGYQQTVSSLSRLHHVGLQEASATSLHLAAELDAQKARCSGLSAEVGMHMCMCMCMCACAAPRSFDLT